MPIDTLTITERESLVYICLIISLLHSHFFVIGIIYAYYFDLAGKLSCL